MYTVAEIVYKMPDYGNVLYWQERYAHDASQTFDWYFTWDTLRPLLEQRNVLNDSEDFEVLLPGVGNSSLPARMSSDGYLNLSCVDISSVVIGQMKARFANLPEADFSVLDCCDSGAVTAALPDACFDVVLDKAVLDAVLCGEDAFAKATSMVCSMYRVLKPGGYYVVVSFGKPEQRLPFLTALPQGTGAWATPEVIEIRE